MAITPGGTADQAWEESIFEKTKKVPSEKASGFEDLDYLLDDDKNNEDGNRNEK